MRHGRRGMMAIPWELTAAADRHNHAYVQPFDADARIECRAIYQGFHVARTLRSRHFIELGRKIDARVLLKDYLLSKMHK